MKPIEKSYLIRAAVPRVWQALVDPLVIEQWGGEPVTMDDNPGTEFRLWGGDIHGKNVEVVPEKRLVQEWYGGDWPAPSIATFTLEDDHGGTLLTLHHIGVPDDSSADFDEGWDLYYLGAIKELLEGD